LNDRRDRQRKRLGLPLRNTDTEEQGECTPLLHPHTTNSGVYGTVAMTNGCGDGDDDLGRDREHEARLSRQIDLVFGPLPGRLLNCHWWRWQLEPLVTCRCVEDSDLEC